MCNNTHSNIVVGVTKQQPTVRSPWTKFLNRQISLPTKINLNRYWSKFGEIMMSPSKVKVNSGRQQQSSNGKAKKKLSFDKDLQNSESFVKNRYQPCRDEVAEVDENILNELKEVRSYKSFEVCHFCATC